MGLVMIIIMMIYKITIVIESKKHLNEECSHSNKHQRNHR